MCCITKRFMSHHQISEHHHPHLTRGSLWCLQLMSSKKCYMNMELVLEKTIYLIKRELENKSQTTIDRKGQLRIV